MGEPASRMLLDKRSIVLLVLGFAAGFATLAGFLGRLSVALDAFSHFRMQYTIALAVFTLLAFFLRKYMMAVVFSLLLLVNASLILPLYISPHIPQQARAHRYRVLLSNVNTYHGNPELVAHVIQEYAPDILVLEEVSAAWIITLKDATAAYPYSCVKPREDNFGIALYSKYPLLKSEEKEIGEAGVPTIIAELELPDGPCAFIATHPLPPINDAYWRDRNDQLVRLAEVVQEIQTPVAVIGDLNMTPWCFAFRKLLRDAGLMDSTRGFGVQPTWPTGRFWLHVPIDHFLHSQEIYVHQRQACSNVGSDHYPLLVEFSMCK